MLKTRRMAHSSLLERGTSLALPWETSSTQAALGKRMAGKHGFEEDQHMYKKHGKDREANLELTMKALVAKALE